MYVLTAVYSDRVIGQHLDDYMSTVSDYHIRHWQPYTATDQIVYVADFNYLLNGMQVSKPTTLLFKYLSAQTYISF